MGHFDPLKMSDEKKSSGHFDHLIFSHLTSSVGQNAPLNFWTDFSLYTSRYTLMYRGVIGCGVYLPMNILYTSASQGIARESTPSKRHLKGSEPRFLMRLGRGWYVYTWKRFIPPKQGFEPHFQNPVREFRRGCHSPNSLPQ